MKYSGKVWYFGDNIDTDMIIPARYLNVSDSDQLAKYCFADVRPEFSEQVKKGDIVVAGNNFGCGSSREHAPIAVKASGVSVIIAKSFARIFYRNAFNIGLGILESVEAYDILHDGDSSFVDINTGEIKNTGTGQSVYAKAIPEFMLNIINSGGLVAMVKKRVAAA